MRNQGRKRQGWKKLESKLNVQSCADAASMEVLRLLANSYKHHRSMAPDQQLLKRLKLTTTVKDASLPQSPDVQEGLARSVGLAGEAAYCDIADRFLTLSERFLADVRNRNTLRKVTPSRGSFMPVRCRIRCNLGDYVCPNFPPCKMSPHTNDSPDAAHGGLRRVCR